VRRASFVPFVNFVVKGFMLTFVFQAHASQAAQAALLFAVGVFLSWPVVRLRLRGVAVLPLALLRMVVRLIGPEPSVVRMAAVIWVFNSVVIFIDLASGFHQLLPALLCLWTGLNIGVVIGMAPREMAMLAANCPRPGRWKPPPGAARLCILLVLLLELPCLFYSVAMGISMGTLVQSGTLHYLPALAVRARAYAAVIVPILLVSAVAEALAIRGAVAQGDG